METSRLFVIVTIRRAASEHLLPRKCLQNQREPPPGRKMSEVSPIPDNLVGALSRHDLADLLEYLTTPR